MQNVLRRMLVVLAGLAGMIPAAAGATTLTYTLPGAPICLSANAPAACNAGGASLTAYAFSFDFPGVPGADEIITAATLTLNVWDDFGRADGSEKIDVVLDVDDILVNGDVQHDIVISLADLAPLSDHLLWVTLGAATGDFFFGGASLALTVEDRPQDEDPAPVTTAAVPLPASLALVGLGLAALAARRRA
jgi:PEP-CTERM motif-containing protein